MPCARARRRPPGPAPLPPRAPRGLAAPCSPGTRGAPTHTPRAPRSLPPRALPPTLAAVAPNPRPPPPPGGLRQQDRLARARDQRGQPPPPRQPHLRQLGRAQGGQRGALGGAGSGAGTRAAGPDLAREGRRPRARRRRAPLLRLARRSTPPTSETPPPAPERLHLRAAQEPPQEVHLHRGPAHAGAGAARLKTRAGLQPEARGRVPPECCSHTRLHPQPQPRHPLHPPTPPPTPHPHPRSRATCTACRPPTTPRSRRCAAS
jgi:hypothetical protein